MFGFCNAKTRLKLINDLTLDVDSVLTFFTLYCQMFIINLGVRCCFSFVFATSVNLSQQNKGK